MRQPVSFQVSERLAVMNTARHSGAIGQNAIVPKIVRRFVRTGFEQILDFGCGKKHIHVDALRDEGYSVYGYDFSLPEMDWTLEIKWDIVYASNVLNVQVDVPMLRKTLQQIRDVCHNDGGLFICNFPQPRHIPLAPKDIEYELGLFFTHVDRYPSPGHHIWVCRRGEFARTIH